jgi:hypothetical protein
MLFNQIFQVYFISFNNFIIFVSLVVGEEKIRNVELIRRVGRFMSKEWICEVICGVERIEEESDSRVSEEATMTMISLMNWKKKERKKVTLCGMISEIEKEKKYVEKVSLEKEKVLFIYFFHLFYCDYSILCKQC